MQLLIEPPLDRWQIGAGDHGADRSALIQCMRTHAQRLGTGHPSTTRPFIATGHQAWLWHPGILVKDLAVLHGADRFNAGAFHVVVDQDVHEALRLELPVVRDGHLSVEVVELAKTLAGVPTGYQPPVDPTLIQVSLTQAQERLGGSLAADPEPIIRAFTNPPPCQTLAQQITAALARLRQPYTPSPIPVLFVSDLPALPAYQTLLHQMLHDARRCANSYNKAVSARPGAGVAPLRVEPDRVELPLWVLRWGQPRQRVFVDLSGEPPIFTLDSGEPIVPQNPDDLEPDRDHDTLGPKALLMTAVLRRWCCDLFVHGRGGQAYDRATEDWWRDWLGEPLAPMAVASADLCMDFDVPVGDTAALQKAVWWRHYLPHNIDRGTREIHRIPQPPRTSPQAVHAESVEHKGRLIDQMGKDRDKKRRAEAYEMIQKINRDLVAAHPEQLTQADARVEQARMGLTNEAVASKRDWCFGFYPQATIHKLVAATATPG